MRLWPAGTLPLAKTSAGFAAGLETRLLLTKTITRGANLTYRDSRNRCIIAKSISIVETTWSSLNRPQSLTVERYAIQDVGLGLDLAVERAAATAAVAGDGDRGTIGL